MKTYEMTASVTGYVRLSVEAESEEAAKEIFNDHVSDMDFGPLYDIDWEEPSIH